MYRGGEPAEWAEAEFSCARVCAPGEKKASTAMIVVPARRNLLVFMGGSSGSKTRFWGPQCYLVIVGGAFEESSEFARARRVAQLAQSFGFDLADAFASDGE